MTGATTKTRQERADEIMEVLRTEALYEGREHVMEVDGGTAVASVRERRGGILVAFSSTRADFADSVAEFVYDYMV